MGQPSSCFVLGIVAACLCSAGSADAGAERTDEIPLIVIVHDRADVLPEILDQALREAARIYGQIGVALEWHSAVAGGKPAAAKEPQASQQPYSVQLIIQDKLRTSHGIAKLQMGAALAPGRDCRGTVYLFNDQVAEFSSSRRVRYALAMGTVIAHEIGHVLLQRMGHSSGGLMRAVLKAGDWERAAMGLLLFAPDDAAIIRANTTICRP
jgi:hypothetical protein